MTVESETYTVSLDGNENPLPLTLAPPNGPGGSSVWRWAVIMNLSPYVALITQTDDTGINTVSLAPGTQNKYQWSNLRGPLKVGQWINPLPSDTAPPGVPQVVIQFSDVADGSDFAGNYPSAIQSALNIGTISGPVSIDGSVAVTSVSGTVTVAGTVNASITNASIAVTGTVSLSAGTAVVVSNDVTVTPSGTINVQGVAGGTAIGIAGSVSISAGTVDIGTVSGNVTVQEIIDTVTQQGSVDLLVNTNVNLPATSTTVLGPYTAVSNYSAIIVVVVGLNLTSYGAQLVLTTPPGGTFPQRFQTQANSNGVTFALPFPCAAGDKFELLIDNTGALVTGAELLVLGVSAPIASFVSTSPGAPIGEYSTGGTKLATVVGTSNTSVQLLAAPPAGMQYRLHTYGWIANQGLTAYSQRYIQLHDTGLGGTIHSDLTIFPATSTLVAGAFDLHGQTATGAVTVVQLTSGNQTIFITYDIIPLQTVS